MCETELNLARTLGASLSRLGKERARKTGFLQTASFFSKFGCFWVGKPPPAPCPDPFLSSGKNHDLVTQTRVHKTRKKPSSGER